MMTPLALLAVLASAAPQTVVLLPVRAVGLSQETASAARTRVLDELQLMGFSLESREEAVEPSCLEDPACRGGLAGDALGVVDVEVLRFGPDLQVTARLFAPDGTERTRTERSVTAEGFGISGTLLGPEFAEALRELAAARGPTSTAGVEADGPDDAPAPIDGAPKEGDDATTSEAEEGGLSPLGLGISAGGAAVLVVGLVVVAGGGFAYLAAQSVLYNAGAARDEKDTALFVRMVGAILFGAGVGITSAGIAVAAAGVAFL